MVARVLSVVVRPLVGTCDVVYAERQVQVHAPYAPGVHLAPAVLEQPLPVRILLVLVVAVVSFLGALLQHLFVLADAFYLELYGAERVLGEPEVAHLRVDVEVVYGARRQQLAVVVCGVDTGIVVVDGLVGQLCLLAALVCAARFHLHLLALVVELYAGRSHEVGRVVAAGRGYDVVAVVDSGACRGAVVGGFVVDGLLPVECGVGRRGVVGVVVDELRLHVQVHLAQYGVEVVVGLYLRLDVVAVGVRRLERVAGADEVGAVDVGDGVRVGAVEGDVSRHVPFLLFPSVVPSRHLRCALVLGSFCRGPLGLLSRLARVVDVVEVDVGRHAQLLVVYHDEGLVGVAAIGSEGRRELRPPLALEFLLQRDGESFALVVVVELYHIDGVGRNARG